MKITIILSFLCLFQNYYTTPILVDSENQLTKLDCNYKDARFGHISLTQVGLKHGTPAFRHIVTDHYLYSYNPCYPFSEEPSCTNVAICQIAKDGSAYYALGINSFVSWSVSVDGNVTLVYTTNERRSFVNLICSNEIDQLLVYGEHPVDEYHFTLFSKCACWNGC